MLLSRHNLASDLGNRHNSYQVTQKTFKTQIKQNFDHFPWSNLPNKKDIVHRCSFQRLWLFPQRLMGTLATSYLAFFSGWFLLGVHFNHCRNTWQACTLFEKESKCLILIFDFRLWHFPPVFVLLKVVCLVTLFDCKLQVFIKKLAKTDHIWHFW